VDQLAMTIAGGVFEFNGGVLNVRASTVSNSVVFTVGNGTSPATYRMSGTTDDTHSFANGVLIGSNATLTGNGIIGGLLTISPGGGFVPGSSVGLVILSNSPALNGTTIMEIAKNGATLTNDQVKVSAPLTYSALLVVSNLGPTALAAGDRFSLFNASAYSGSFSSFTIPKPGAGLNWTNKLLVDGSIEVVPWSGPKIGSPTLFGTNLVFGVTAGLPSGAYDVVTATNFATPLTSWLVASSGTFDWLGNTTVTNGISPGEPQRYFCVRSL
jgi:hypothetical protein